VTSASLRKLRPGSMLIVVCTICALLSVSGCAKAKGKKQKAKASATAANAKPANKNTDAARKSLHGKARNIKPGMTQAEAIGIMGCEPDVEYSTGADGGYRLWWDVGTLGIVVQLGHSPVDEIQRVAFIGAADVGYYLKTRPGDR
jgi:hypothetical protein